VTDRYLTLVFDDKAMQHAERERLIKHPAVSYMAWGHVPYERDEWKAKAEHAGESSVEQINEQLSRQIAAMERMANALEWMVRRHHA
jgi:hypothetical protein